MDEDVHLIMAEDALMYFFILLNCKSITTSSKNIYCYCQNDSSCTSTNDIAKMEKNLKDDKVVIETLSNFLNCHKKNIEGYLYIFLKIMVIELTTHKLSREIKFYLLTRRYIIYKFKKIKNKFLIKYLSAKITILTHTVLHLSKIFPCKD